MTSKSNRRVPERCIEHCRLFLFSDHTFVKDKLVQMWMAEDCIEIKSGVTARMEEDIGKSYFDALVTERVIEASRPNDTRCNSLSLSLAPYELYTWLYNYIYKNDNDNYMRIKGRISDVQDWKVSPYSVLHLTWHSVHGSDIYLDSLQVFKNFKNLRTLRLEGSISRLPHYIFLGLTQLRSLDMSCTGITVVPASVGSLECLRYLNVSGTPVKELPQSVAALNRLQTLNLNLCNSLVALPRELGRLVNLRHLNMEDIVHRLESMPSGMGDLTQLQTLRGFIVGKNVDGCGIGELKHMNEITGSFCISRLENVTSAEEAKEAALSDKRYIDKLGLEWQPMECGNLNIEETAEILESLQPHFNFKELEVTCYVGSKLPSWISNPAYTHLYSITLSHCENCDFLPSMGQLSNLMTLWILNMRNLRNINTGLCRAGKAFPRLERLTLHSMVNLQRWTGVKDGDFPHLRRIKIVNCPKLLVLPSRACFSSLEEFELRGCTCLTSWRRWFLPASLESLMITGCRKVRNVMRPVGLSCSKHMGFASAWKRMD